jgi:hypothetical protein
MKIIPLAAFITGLCFSSVNVESQSIPFLTNGLIAYYPFNGNANDASGNENNGTLTGITFSTDRFGNPNASASFAGTSSSYITVNTTSFNLQSNLTVAAWINPGAGFGTGGPRVFSTAGYELAIGTTPGTNTFFQFSGAGPTPTNVASGEWTHVVAAISNTTSRIYVNGVLVGVGTLTEPIDYSHGWIPKIGGNAGKTTDDNYDGLIDDLAIYNRTLSAQEISELYESFAAGIITLPTITITGSTNQTYSIQYVTNVSSTNWTTLASNIVLQGNSFLYPDTNAVNQPGRFYRVLVQ